MTETRPVIALAMGDPAGVSPELTARLIALDDVRAAAHLVVIGDRRILDEGARAAGLTLDLETATLEDFETAGGERHVFIDLGHLDDGSDPGLLVRPDDPDALAEALRHWLEDPQQRSRLRRSAGLRRLTLPTWSGTTAQVARALEGAR